MPGKKIIQVGGRGVYIPGNDIDTDQLIPAIHLKEVTFDRMGDYFFKDARLKAGHDHPLNNPKYAGASVLLGDENFGCGSSREHAVQAMFRAGFYSMIAESFAEIFFGNAIANGLAMVTASSKDISKMVTAIEDNPQIHILIDLENMVTKYETHTVDVHMPDSARTALIEGLYDPVPLMLEAEAEIEATAARQPYMNDYKIA